MRAGVFSGRADPGDRAHSGPARADRSGVAAGGPPLPRWWRCARWRRTRSWSGSGCAPPPMWSSWPCGPHHPPMRERPVVVFATYASPGGSRRLRGPDGPGQGSWAAGGRPGGRGAPVRAADERFRPRDRGRSPPTAGDLGRPWAAIHDNARIPAGFRLYSPPPCASSPRPGRSRAPAGASWRSRAWPTTRRDLRRVAGRTRTEEAIERGILAGFEIDVLEIRDPSPSLASRRKRSGPAPGSCCRPHCWSTRRRTTCVRSATFHQKVEEAAAFAEKMPQTAAELYGIDASDEDLAAADRLPASSIGAGFYELEAGRHVPPDRVWSAWLCGDHPSPSAARCCASSQAASTPRVGACTGRSSPAAGCSRGRGHHRRTGSRLGLLRRHPHLPGGDRAEHRPRAAAQPGRQHEGRADHRARLPPARRGPGRHGRLRLVCGTGRCAPGPAQP